MVIFLTIQHNTHITPSLSFTFLSLPLLTSSSKFPNFPAIFLSIPLNFNGILTSITCLCSGVRLNDLSMPLLDIAIAQSSFQNYLGYSRVRLFIPDKIPNYCLLQHTYRWPSFRKSFQNTGYLSSNLGHSYKKLQHKFSIKAVATLEPKCSAQNKDEKKESHVLSSSIDLLPSAIDSTLDGDSEEIDERERLRRIRISKANKGNTPWNKGRKHRPETVERIRERTRLAMQNPKVKMKLANIGHAQSQETREKIALGVRMGWERRRAKILIQETCLFDWHNLIAEAARKGFQHEEELQWDSYKIMYEQLLQEWLASVEQRKVSPRPRGNKRAPKSLEQRRKIAEAIAAKWADPEYRARVSNGLAKFHGIPEGAERKVKRKPRDGTQRSRTPKKKVSNAEKSSEKVNNQQLKLKKRTTPKYKDPLANSKLEMLKNIRAQRVASESRKNEAFERAKLLIVEAEKATKALEVAATRSPVVRASLIEARKLIAEATESIKSIENEELTSQDDLTLGRQDRMEKDESTVAVDDAHQGYHIGVNGTDVGFHIPDGQIPDDGIYKMPTLKDMDLDRHLQRRSGGREFSKLDIGSYVEKSGLREVADQQHLPELNGSCIKINGRSSHHEITKTHNLEEQVHPAPGKPAAKKWVRGRLVEVLEGE